MEELYPQFYEEIDVELADIKRELRGVCTRENEEYRE